MTKLRRKPLNNPGRKPVPLDIPEERILDALEGCGGVMKDAATYLGISRYVMHKYKKMFPSVERMQDAFRGVMVDAAESCIARDVDSGDQRASMFVLNCLAKNRGYGNADLPAELGAPAKIIINPPSYPRDDD